MLTPKKIIYIIYLGIPTTMKTMGANITTIAYLRVLIIEIGSTSILMVVEAQGIYRTYLCFQWQMDRWIFPFHPRKLNGIQPSVHPWNAARSSQRFGHGLDHSQQWWPCGKRKISIRRTKQTAVKKLVIPLRVTKSCRSQLSTGVCTPQVVQEFLPPTKMKYSTHRIPPKYRGSPPLPTSLQNPCIHTLSWHEIVLQFGGSH